MPVFTCDPDLQEKQEFFSEIAKIREAMQISSTIFVTAPVSFITVHTIFLANYPDVKLKKPIKLIYERGSETGAFIVGNEVFNKYGIGNTKEEALKDFEDNLFTDYLELKESSFEQLTEGAKELLEIYQGYF